MILAEHLESDTASTNTLIDSYVEDTQSTQKTPRHLGKLLITSIFMNMVAFSFSLAQTVPEGESILSAANILGCILTLPHHFAALLVVWLHRHHSESIFSFSPQSPRAVAYNIFLVVIWVAATTLSAVTLHSESSIIFYDNCSRVDPINLVCTQYTYIPGIGEYWLSLSSTLTSALALILVTTVAVVCYMQGRRIRKAASGSSPTSPREHKVRAKIISA